MDVGGASEGRIGEVVSGRWREEPGRLAPRGPVVRGGGSTVGGVVDGRRGAGGVGLVLAAAAGAAGGAVGTWGGAAWRRLAVGERPDWPGAVAEDVTALALAAWAVRG